MSDSIYATFRLSVQRILHKFFLFQDGQSVSDLELLLPLLYLAHPPDTARTTAESLLGRFGSFDGVLGAHPQDLWSIASVTEETIGALKYANALRQR